jgi:hypothetical protein
LSRRGGEEKRLLARRSVAGARPGAENALRYEAPVSAAAEGRRIRCRPPALRERRRTANRDTGETRLLDEEQPRLEIAGQSPHSFPQLKAEKNVGKALSVYWQQPPSQQAGLSQQVATDAACADNEMKKTAANANTSALSFIMISFWKMLHDRHTRASCVFDVRAIEKQKERKMSA